MIRKICGNCAKFEKPVLDCLQGKCHGFGKQVIDRFALEDACVSFAKRQVSWLLPGSVSSQEGVPVTLVRCTKKANTVAGTAPAFHRIPSLPYTSRTRFEYHHLRCKVTTFFIPNKKYEEKIW